MAVAEDSSRSELWVERAATVSGIDSLVGHVARRIESDGSDRTDPYGPYLLVTLLVSIDVLGLGAVGYLQTGAFLPLDNPGELLILPGWLFVLWSIFKLRALYEATVEKLPCPYHGNDDVSSDSNERLQPVVELVFPSESGQSFETIFPWPQKIVILLLGWAYHVGWILTDPTAGSYVTSTAGELVAFLKFGVVYPFFYYPIGVEFLTLFLAIHLLLPFRIAEQRRIEFEDPHGYGGLRQVGELSKNSTVHYFLLLSLYIGFVSLTKGVSTGESAHLMLIAAGTGTGAVLFFVPILWVGFHMQALKKEKIEEIMDDAREHGGDDRTFPETAADSSSDASAYAHEYARLAVVKEMNDYPVDVFSLRDFAYALPIPFVINLLTTYVTNNVLTI